MTQVAVKTDKERFRKDIMKFEERFRKIPGVLYGHDNDEYNLPLKHTFVPGSYVREIFMPKGVLLTSKIHKVEHPYFVMKGRCAVLTETGIQVIKAPYHGITQPGTKRLIYMYEDTVWITVHSTEEKDLEKIEQQIIAKTFNDLALTHDDFLKIEKEG